MFNGVVDLNIIVTFFAITGGLADPLHVQLLQQHLARAEGPAEPVEEQHAGVDRPVEHVHGNWRVRCPVHRWAYDYSKPGKPEDWVSQITRMGTGRKGIADSGLTCPLPWNGSATSAGPRPRARCLCTASLVRMLKGCSSWVAGFACGLSAIHRQHRTTCGWRRSPL